MSGALAAREPLRVLTPFPTKQMTILALCRICEPIAFMSIFPYVYYMIQDFGVTKHPSEISIYAGMVTSAFALAEFSSGLAWGRLSDRIGRKPVLLAGLSGTALSMLSFGFATSLPVALMCRALGGLLNGNIGVLQTTVAELVPEKEHQPRAFSLMPFVWCLGSILGPILGGALARPAISYPEIFASESLWGRYPYLLPNLVCTVIITFGVIFGVLYLEETHADKKHLYDPGLAAGRWIITKFPQWDYKASCITSEKDDDVQETTGLLNADQPSNYCATTNELAPLPIISPISQIDNTLPTSKPAASKAFTNQIILNIIGYGILAYHTIAIDSMLPTVFSTPTPHDTSSWRLPFKFVTGYGLSTKEIGIILSVQGIFSMFATLCLFPSIVRFMGVLPLFRTVAFIYPALYFLVPYFALLPPDYSKLGIYVLVIWKCILSTMAYPSNAIMLTNSTPSFLTLGMINGVAASTASLSRAFSPTLSGLLFSTGEKLGYSGLPWWCNTAISIIGAVLALFMVKNDNRPDVNEKSDEEIESRINQIVPTPCSIEDEL
ncbi:unnamed protein product [Blumeria hordei]|uniref:Major facilitator superfamily (MFS) profile domain-containing protein n=2 Tax=Blumeria hordei TaxID=2867405 RepID=A0A383USS6_BLUHO|nr:MFS Transporter [Blumeria hordei DH14]SZF03381.1 unnamed protein product [Blumeria hordei]